MTDVSELDGMARAFVTVVSVEGGKALVDATPTGSCDSCAGTKGCGSRTLLAIFGTKTAPLEIDNVFEAKTGDRLEIGIEQIKILKLSAVCYLLPLIGLIGGGVLGVVSDSGNLASFLWGLFGLLAGFTYGRYLFNSSRWDSEIAPVCLRRLSSDHVKYFDPEVID